jgi:hypothetical protein
MTKSYEIAMRLFELVNVIVLLVELIKPSKTYEFLSTHCLKDVSLHNDEKGTRVSHTNGLKVDDKLFFKRLLLRLIL